MFCDFLDYTITKYHEKRDAIIVISGDAGSGKTRCALRIAYTIAKLRKVRFNPTIDIYYNSIETLSNDLLSGHRLIRLVDEGYDGFHNLDTNTTSVKTTTRAVAKTRNRGHVLIICLQKLTRGAKPLLERANYWIHKPHIDFGYLYVRDRMFVGDDPWSVADLLAADNDYKKLRLLKSNPNFITAMRVPRISEKIFDKYEIAKMKAQEDEVKGAKAEDTFRQKEALIMKDMYTRMKGGEWRLESIKKEFVEHYKISSFYVDEWIRKYKRYLITNDTFQQLDLNIEDTEL